MEPNSDHLAAGELDPVQLGFGVDLKLSRSHVFGIR